MLGFLRKLRYGRREWRMVVMTREIHGHMGIYSTIGVKMGLAAREIFEKEGIKDHISVLSYAGTVPPVSCLGDGLQISTGATIGHGLISISDEAEKRVEAIFTSGGKTLTLKLKPEFEARIKADIEEGVAKYGHKPEYWEYVRKLALKYWAEWDRKQLFLLK